MRGALALAAVLVAGTAPLSAQDHAGHGAHGAGPAPDPTAACEAEAARHRAMGHPVAQGQCAPASGVSEQDAGASSANHEQMNHGAMDLGTMDHSAMAGMDHARMSASDDIPVTPAPLAAGSGPPRAADAIWGAEAMRASRDALPAELGDTLYHWVQADRLEYRVRRGADGYLWDIQGYYGGDLDKFWFKSEGEGSFGEDPEQAELQALYSRAIGPWFDLQAGVRQDLTGPTRTHAVIGVQGLAPYLFEIDAAAFLSDAGDVTARIEAELDQRVTQRLILQPRLEVDLAAQDVSELDIRAGVDAVSVGVRLRYEIVREFAPYVGVEHEWKPGGSVPGSAFGMRGGTTQLVMGLRAWF